MLTVTDTSFKDLVNLHTLSTSNPKLCCKQLHSDGKNLTCKTEGYELSSCEDMLESQTFRIFLWLFGTMALLGNGSVILYRLKSCRQYMAKSFHILVMNLSCADFLMGIYMMILGVADIRFKGHYFIVNEKWKSGWVCAMTGMLGLVSCEVSALMVAFITLDRLLVTWLPLKQNLQLNHRYDLNIKTAMYFPVCFI